MADEGVREHVSGGSSVCVCVCVRTTLGAFNTLTGRTEAQREVINYHCLIQRNQVKREPLEAKSMHT